jgi:hypothetical protein
MTMSIKKFAKHERRIGIGLEGTYGAYGVIGRYVPAEDVALDYTREVVTRDEVGVLNTANDTYQRTAMLQPKITVPFNPDTVGEMLHSLMGTVTTTIEQGAAGGTAYRHVFKLAGTVADSLMSLTFKEDWGQGTAYDYVGVRIGAMTLSCAAKETLKGAFDGVGQREIAGTSAPATIGYGTLRPFIFSDMAMTMDGTALGGVYNMEFTVNRNLSDGFRMGTQAYTTRPLPSKSNIGLKFTTEYEAVDRLRYLSGSTMNIQTKFTGDQILIGTTKPELIIKLPKYRYTASPFGYGDDNIRTMSIDGIALSGGTSTVGTSDSVIIELINNVGSYTAF